MRLIRNADSSFIQLCDDIDIIESELRDARQLIEADNAALKETETKLKRAKSGILEIRQQSIWAKDKLCEELLSDLEK